jgi:hypothetical protein
MNAFRIFPTPQSYLYSDTSLRAEALSVLGEGARRSNLLNRNWGEFASSLLPLVEIISDKYPLCNTGVRCSSQRRMIVCAPQIISIFNYSPHSRAYGQNPYC